MTNRRMATRPNQAKDRASNLLGNIALFTSGALFVFAIDALLRIQ